MSDANQHPNSCDSAPLTPQEARLELLITRRLDGQISPADDAELNRMLAADAVARVKLQEYVRIEQISREVLTADICSSDNLADPAKLLWSPAAPQTIKDSRVIRPRLTIAAAALSAAAVIAFSFAPAFWKAGTAEKERLARQVVAPGIDSGADPGPTYDQPAAARSLVDYRPVDYRPAQRQLGLQRDLIGVRGDDPDVIYIFERNTLSTRLVPITGDF